MDNQFVITKEKIPLNNNTNRHSLNSDSNEFGLLINNKQKLTFPDESAPNTQRRPLKTSKPLYSKPKFLMKPFQQLFSERQSSIKGNSQQFLQSPLPTKRMSSQTHQQLLQLSQQAQAQSSTLATGVGAPRKKLSLSSQVMSPTLQPSTAQASRQQQITNISSSLKPGSTQQSIQPKTLQSSLSESSLTVKKNIFENSPLKQYFDQGQGTVLDLGPRYTSKGKLINYSVVGNAQWFSAYSKKVISNHGTSNGGGGGSGDAEDMAGIVNMALVEQKKKLQEQQNQQLITGRASFCGSKSGMKIKRGKLDQNILTKDILLMQMDKLQSQIQEYNNSNQNQHNNITEQLQQTKQERVLKAFQQQQQQWNKISQSILSKQTNHNARTMMLSSQEIYRQSKEVKDLLELSKPVYQLTGTNSFWQLSLHNSRQAAAASQSIQDFSQLTTSPSVQNTKAEFFKTEPDSMNTATGNGCGFNSFVSSTAMHKNLGKFSKLSSKVQPSLECRGCLVKTYIDENDIEVIRNPKSTLTNQTLTSTTSSLKSFYTNDLFNKTQSENVTRHKKFIQSIFQTDCTDLMGESKFERERDSLLHDGNPRYQYYIKFTEDTLKKKLELEQKRATANATKNVGRSEINANGNQQPGGSGGVAGDVNGGAGCDNSKNQLLPSKLNSRKEIIRKKLQMTHF